jgi:hypothetical protein
LFALAYIWASPSLARPHWDSLEYASACEVRGLGAISLSVLLLIVAWGLIIWSFDCPSHGRSLLSGIAFGAATLERFEAPDMLERAGVLRTSMPRSRTRR